MFRKKDDEQNKVTMFFKSTRDKFNKAANDIKDSFKPKAKNTDKVVVQNFSTENKESPRLPPLPKMPRPKLIRPIKKTEDPSYVEVRKIREEYEKLMREREDILKQQKEKEIQQIDYLKARILNDFNELKIGLNSINKDRYPNQYTIAKLQVDLYLSTYHELSKCTEINRAINIMEDHNYINSNILPRAYEILRLGIQAKSESKHQATEKSDHAQDHKHSKSRLGS